MARANRHYIPGHVWHLTHRCHKREFVFNFAKDRLRWMQWLYETRKKHHLVILNYMVTSNHTHLPVYDNGSADVIPKSVQLLAGRIGQEYNIRKKRKGAFRQDRYHAAAVETGEHLQRCLVYIDLNMVRAGIVEHPSQWYWCGYNEIQSPRRKNVLIDYEKFGAFIMMTHRFPGARIFRQFFDGKTYCHALSLDASGYLRASASGM